MQYRCTEEDEDLPVATLRGVKTQPKGGERSFISVGQETADAGEAMLDEPLEPWRRSAYASPAKRFRDAQRAEKFRTNRSALDDCLGNGDGWMFHDSSGGFDFFPALDVGAQPMTCTVGHVRPTSGEEQQLDECGILGTRGGFDFFQAADTLKLDQVTNCGFISGVTSFEGVSSGGGGGGGGYREVGVDGDVPAVLFSSGVNGAGGGVTDVATGGFLREAEGEADVGGGGGRGIYCNVDGDFPLAALPDTQAAARNGYENRSSSPTALGGTKLSCLDAQSERRQSCPSVGELTDTCIMHVNIQGLRSHMAELTAVIRLSRTCPDIVCVNETFLDDAVGEAELEGFSVVGRRDRSYNGDDRSCGGVIVYAKTEIADQVTLLLISDDSERMWFQLHTITGPYLLAAWYRPPVPGEVQTISSFGDELNQLRGNALGTLLLGDLNLHSKRWLCHSASNSKEGEMMREWCRGAGFRQIVRQPTRGAHLLDLGITDIESASATVAAQIADHSSVIIKLNITLPRTLSHSRKVWTYRNAEWDSLKEELGNADWAFLKNVDTSQAVHQSTELILGVAKKHIPQRTMETKKSSHPWITEDILHLVANKKAAEGTPCYEEAVKKMQYSHHGKL